MWDPQCACAQAAGYQYIPTGFIGYENTSDKRLRGSTNNMTTDYETTCVVCKRRI